MCTFDLHMHAHAACVVPHACVFALRGIKASEACGRQEFSPAIPFKHHSKYYTR